MNNPKTTIIIPTYNEAKNISRLITAISEQKIPNLNIIIIDDNSPDGTAKIVEGIQANSPTHTITLISRPQKQGLGSAYILGFNKALENKSSLIFEMDADFSHDPQMIPKLIKTAQTADVIIGSRRITGGNVTGWNMRRNIQSRAAAFIARAALKLKTKDVTSGFRCYRKSVLKKIPLKNITSQGYAFQVEILWWCEKLGFSVKEIPITFIDRTHGRSKLSSLEMLKFFTTLLRLSFTPSPSTAISSPPKTGQMI